LPTTVTLFPYTTLFRSDAVGARKVIEVQIVRPYRPDQVITNRVCGVGLHAVATRDAEPIGPLHRLRERDARGIKHAIVQIIPPDEIPGRREAGVHGKRLAQHSVAVGRLALPLKSQALHIAPIRGERWRRDLIEWEVRLNRRTTLA